VTASARVPITSLLAAEPHELGRSDWHRVDQASIDSFAALTGDRQWIHIDRERAASGPFGTTVAHGFLVLALIPLLLEEIVDLSVAKLLVNYGFDRVRFTAPTPSDAEVRLAVRLTSSEPKGETAHLVRLGCSLEIAGSEKPALVAEFLVLVYQEATVNV
jgi:acyl dehydratase